MIATSLSPSSRQAIPPEEVLVVPHKRRSSTRSRDSARRAVSLHSGAHASLSALASVVALGFVITAGRPAIAQPAASVALAVGAFDAQAAVWTRASDAPMPD